LLGKRLKRPHLEGTDGTGTLVQLRSDLIGAHAANELQHHDLLLLRRQRLEGVPQVIGLKMQLRLLMRAGRITRKRDGVLDRYGIFASAVMVDDGVVSNGVEPGNEWAAARLIA
jgi:hypothetical protein